MPTALKQGTNRWQIIGSTVAGSNPIGTSGFGIIRYLFSAIAKG
jgi:hypothetical protein